MLFGDRKVQDDVLSYINDLQLSINRQGKASEFADSVLECLSNRMLNGVSMRLDAGGRLVHL